MRRALGFLVFGLAFFSLALHADVVVNTSLNLTSLTISVGGMTVTPAGVTASAFASVFDSAGLPPACTASGAVLTGICFGFDSETTIPASVSASQGAASASAGADPTGLTANASSSVNIPDGISDFAGTNMVGPYGDLSGTFEVVSSSPTPAPVMVTFSAKLSGSQSLFTSPQGLSAYSETIFNLVANGTTELFHDSPFSIGPSSMVVNPISTTLTSTDSSLMTNTVYSFDAQVDAESTGLNAPEPSFFVLIGLGLSALLTARAIRRRGSLERNG